MKRTLATAMVASMFALPVVAEGDAEAGEKAFKKCKACHAVKDAAGETIVKGGKTGPNLYGLPGMTAGTVEDFKRYKKGIVAAGEAGLVWDEEQFVSYVADPTKFLRAFLDDGKAKSGMTFKLKKEQDALNIWAFLQSVSPES